MIRTFKSAALKRYWKRAGLRGCLHRTSNGSGKSSRLWGGYRARRYGFTWIKFRELRGTGEAPTRLPFGKIARITFKWEKDAP